MGIERGGGMSRLNRKVVVRRLLHIFGIHSWHRVFREGNAEYHKCRLCPRRKWEPVQLIKGYYPIRWDWLERDPANRATG